MRDIVGGYGVDVVMDCSGHPSAGPEGIEFLRDGGCYVEMGQFTDAGSIETNWHRICTKDDRLRVLPASLEFGMGAANDVERCVNEQSGDGCSHDQVRPV